MSGRWWAAWERSGVNPAIEKSRRLVVAAGDMRWCPASRPAMRSRRARSERSSLVALASPNRLDHQATASGDGFERGGGYVQFEGAGAFPVVDLHPAGGSGWSSESFRGGVAVHP